MKAQRDQVSYTKFCERELCRRSVETRARSHLPYKFLVRHSACKIVWERCERELL